MSTKLVLPILFALLFVSCEVDPYEETSGKTLEIGSLSKKTLSDALKDGQHWVEAADGTIYWDENATSQGTTKPGETYLGPNVLVGTHNRDSNLNEPINSAKFQLYLEKNKNGSSAEIMGNTVPADVKKYGTLAEGLYPARVQGRRSYIERGDEDLAIIINEGRSVPTAPGSPKTSMTGIFFHSGNDHRKSLHDSKGNAYSAGCQTSGCGPDSRPLHNEFMNTAGSKFNGSYYLRPNPN
ncbi:hypothetical protein E6C50_00810 [Flavobacterium supellecticarium]|uniref:Uncharacterized protein n=1 Tax=Flavobacterium supellecticarium TaxID=2565924 RepID=A0A4S4A4A2_9FLAO|nr:hypothetical protein [Flavobacterium supellecticarium]THF52785.1 hypothetical protein E6C50_00810 [Flavobacterium supellecticarium]